MLKKILPKVVLYGLLGILVTGSSRLGAQTATGAVVGTVQDGSGAVVPGANVTITNKGTAVSRSLVTNSDGLYSAPSLQAGDYEVKVESSGFRTTVLDAQVLAGTTTTANVTLSLGEAQQTVTVEAVTAQMNYDSNTVAGSIERGTIQDMPLNGRSFLQLASLEPGVQIIAGATGARNAPVQISILGAATNQSFTTNNTLITLDGLSLMDQLDGGNTDLNFSQEVVQEFQISSLNFDISTGITSSGTVNIVSRSGSNDFHGSAFYFYRDHNMAAYPALNRSPLAPNPYFVRKDPGFWLGGPIKKDKIFFFASYEALDQINTITFQPNLPSLQPLASNFSSPFRYHYPNVRFDYRISDKHTAFLRYTHDGNAGFAPEVGTPSEPSAWINLNNFSDQFAMGVTSTLSPTLVNDFRLGWRIWDNKENLPTATQCQAPCIDGVQDNGPNLSLIGALGFSAGVTGNASQRRIARHYEPQDTLTWQKGNHRIRFGGDMDVYVDLWYWGLCANSCAVGWSTETTQATLAAYPGAVQTYFPNLPTRITTTAQLYNEPFFSGSSYLGNLIIPGRYHQDSERRDFRPKVFVQDTWKIRPNLSVNYGLAWQVETGDFNSDLPNPAFLAPILGANNLHPTPVQWHDFEPAVGFAWSPGKSSKWVIRGGAGVYFDSMPGYYRMSNIGTIGPLGDGPISVSNAAFSNPFPGIVEFVGGKTIPVPVGAPIPTAVLSNFTVGDWVQAFQAQKGAISAALGPIPPISGPYSVTGLNISKSSGYLFPPNEPNPRSFQTSIGVQRDLGHDMVATVDYARRLSDHTQLSADLNHFNEFVNGVRTPVIPACTKSPDLNPNDQCSSGPLSFLLTQGRTVYEGLLVKLAKRFSNRYQFTASYAYQNLNGIAGIVNYNNWFQSYGPLMPRQNLNISGTVNLPWGFELSLNSSMQSRNPFTALTTGVDLDGTGATSSTPLPGLPYNCLNITCGRQQLIAAVANFNATYAGTKQPNGLTIPKYVLPPNYQFGTPTISQDFRLTKTFAYKERYRLDLFVEAFNAFNIANLTGYSGALDIASANPANQTYSFGRPTQRAGQTFLSYGPRAIQVGGRVTF
jgi:hypothetical protein